MGREGRGGDSSSSSSSEVYKVSGTERRVDSVYVFPEARLLSSGKPFPLFISPRALADPLSVLVSSQSLLRPAHALLAESSVEESSVNQPLHLRRFSRSLFGRQYPAVSSQRRNHAPTRRSEPAFVQARSRRLESNQSRVHSRDSRWVR